MSVRAISVPPPIPGARDATTLDAFRLAWWSQRGFWHRVRHCEHGRACAFALALLWWPTWPLHVIVRTALFRGRSLRYYISPDRDAVVAVVVRSGAWRVTEHLSKRPGHGLGRRLREIVGPPLLEAADAEGIRVFALTGSPRLAREYAREYVDDGITTTAGGTLFTLERPPGGA